MSFYQGSTADHATAAANTAVVITYPATTGFRHVVDEIIPSYSGAPTGGYVQVEDGAGNILRRQDLATAAPGSISFGPGLGGTPGRAMIITLAAAGAGVIGRLNVRKRIV